MLILLMPMVAGDFRALLTQRAFPTLDLSFAILFFI